MVALYHPLQDSQQSVTVVLFQDEHTLISAGAVDGYVTTSIRPEDVIPPA